MLINTRELGGSDSIRFMTAMSELGLGCAGLINEATRFEAQLESTTDTSRLHRLTGIMGAWLRDNPVLDLHLSNSLRDLGVCLTNYHSCLADALDVEIAKRNLIDKLRMCVQIFSIEQELIDTLWCAGG